MERHCIVCGKNFDNTFGVQLICNECVKVEWIKNRGERLEKEIFTANKVTEPNDFGREYTLYDENQFAFDKITKELLQLYCKKNKDYGNAFGDTFEQFGIVSAVIRLNDKMNRLKKLTATGSQEVKDESIRDTLVDLANYAIMTLVEIDKNGQE